MCPHCRTHSCEAPNRTATCRGTNGPAPLQCGVCKGKVNLRARRLSVANMMAPVHGLTTGFIQQAWTTRAINIVADLYDEFFGGGGPPCDYAFCITGSGARREACPYSDLDCFIVLDPTAGVPEKTQILQVSQQVKNRLDYMTWDRETVAANGAPDKGFTFCTGGLNPGGWNGIGVPIPQLTGTPAELANILETNLNTANGALEHVISGLQESGFGFGKAQLHRDLVTEVDQIMGKTCWKMSSRPALSHRKRRGTEAIHQAVTDPDFAIPNPGDTRFNIKKGFYRLPQFVTKGLAWYYGVNSVSSDDQIHDLTQAGHMHANKAAVFRRALDAPLRLRISAQLSSGKEHDYVRSAAHGGANPDNELVLSAGQLLSLQNAIADLQQIRQWSQNFLAQKKKVIGKRKNAFANP